MHLLQRSPFFFSDGITLTRTTRRLFLSIGFLPFGIGRPIPSHRKYEKKRKKKKSEKNSCTAPVLFLLEQQPSTRPGTLPDSPSASFRRLPNKRTTTRTRHRQNSTEATSTDNFNRQIRTAQRYQQQRNDYNTTPTTTNSNRTATTTTERSGNVTYVPGAYRYSIPLTLRTYRYSSFFIRPLICGPTYRYNFFESCSLVRFLVPPNFY